MAAVLSDHLNAKETELLAQCGATETAGHSLHKGTPREVFVREFLGDHLSERLEVVPAALGGDAGLIGAARAAMREDPS